MAGKVKVKMKTDRGAAKRFKKLVVAIQVPSPEPTSHPDKEDKQAQASAA